MTESTQEKVLLSLGELQNVTAGRGHYNTIVSEHRVPMKGDVWRKHHDYDKYADRGRSLRVEILDSPERYGNYWRVRVKSLRSGRTYWMRVGHLYSYKSSLLRNFSLCEVLVSRVGLSVPIADEGE